MCGAVHTSKMCGLWGTHIVLIDCPLCESTALTFLLLALLACSRGNSVTAKDAGSASPTNVAAAESPQSAPGQNAPAPPPDSPDVHVSGTRALQYTREMVAMGPRPIGSPAHAKLESYLRQHLRNDNLEEDTFIAETPVGKFPSSQLHRKVSRHKRRHHRDCWPLRDEDAEELRRSQRWWRQCRTAAGTC